MPKMTRVKTHSQSSKKYFSNKNLFLGLVTIILLLFVLGGMILGFYAVRAYLYYRSHQTNFIGDSFIVEDPDVGFVARPSSTMCYLANPVYTVYTDTIGARVGREGLKGPTHVDILGIGCSMTWGHGVEDEETYLKVLGQKTKLEVANVAMPSYGMTTALLSLKKYEFLKPKVVIYGFITDQINRSSDPCAPCISPLCRAVAFTDFDQNGKPFIHTPISKTSSDYYAYLKQIVWRHPFGWTDIHWAVRRDILKLTRRDVPGINQRYAPRDIEKYRYKTVSYLLDQMVAETRKMGAAFILVYIPVPTGILPPPEELVEAMKPYTDDPDFAFVDLTGPFKAFRERYGETAMKPGGIEAHLSPAVHELVADTLKPIVETRIKKDAS